jgi:molecular chaperone GrpE
MTLKAVSSVFSSMGIEAVGLAGESFDPNLHNAVMHVEDESLGEGVIVEVFERGYKKNKKVIRFAMVKTAN